MTTHLRHRDRIGEGDLVIEVAFTDVSLDLGDRAPAGERERALAVVAAETGATPVLMRQVHGDRALVVDAAGAPEEGDAMCTGREGLALLARAADCVPVLLADPATGWVAAVHAGRRGLATGVVASAVTTLRERGARPTTAWVGPHVCGACYAVPPELRDEVTGVVPEARSTTSWGTPALDLGAGVLAHLAALGVDDVREVRACTREDPSWPSHRRDGDASTRFAGVIWSHR